MSSIRLCYAWPLLAVVVCVDAALGQPPQAAFIAVRAAIGDGSR